MKLRTMPLAAKDAALVRLAVGAFQHRWEALPHLGRTCLDAGGSQHEVRGCVRHLAVCAAPSGQPAQGCFR